MIKLRVYKDKGGKWRWRMRAENGRTVATSGESFASKANAERAAKRLNEHLRDGLVLIVDGTP